MPRTPDRQPGAADEEELVLEDRTADAAPSLSGALRYRSNRIELFNGTDVKRLVTDFPSGTVDPTGTPVDGDLYYNTALRMWMFYDAGRGKWLSIDAAEIHFARNGNTADGAYYRASDGRSFSDVDGRFAEFNGTVVSLTYTRGDNDAATFEVTRNGTLVTGATLASSAVSGKSTTLNADFAADGVLGVRNQASGNTTTNVLGWVRVRWRA